LFGVNTVGLFTPSRNEPEKAMATLIFKREIPLLINDQQLEILDVPRAHEKRSDLSNVDFHKLAKVVRVTSIGCYVSCELIYSRSFLKGDHYVRIVGRCPKCCTESYVRTSRTSNLKPVKV
jgi:hypothetical protein